MHGKFLRFALLVYQYLALPDFCLYHHLHPDPRPAHHQRSSSENTDPLFSKDTQKSKLSLIFFPSAHSTQNFSHHLPFSLQKKSLVKTSCVKTCSKRRQAYYYRSFTHNVPCFNPSHLLPCLKYSWDRPVLRHTRRH